MTLFTALNDEKYRLKLIFSAQKLKCKAFQFFSNFSFK